MKYQPTPTATISDELVAKLHEDGYLHHWRTPDGRIERDYLDHEAFVNFLSVRDDPDGGCIISIYGYDKHISSRKAYARGYSKAFIANGELTCQWRPFADNMSQVFVDMIAQYYAA